MSKRPISLKTAVSIASLRMSLLSRLSLKSLENDDEELARRYICVMRRISLRLNVPISKELLFCKKCNIPLVIGNNCRVRLNTRRIKITCLKCSNIKRFSYIKR